MDLNQLPVRIVFTKEFSTNPYLPVTYLLSTELSQDKGQPVYLPETPFPGWSNSWTPDPSYYHPRQGVRLIFIPPEMRVPDGL